MNQPTDKHLNILKFDPSKLITQRFLQRTPGSQSERGLGSVHTYQNNVYRPNGNEDKFIIAHYKNQYSLFGVFDGHGGDRVAILLREQLAPMIFKCIVQFRNEMVAKGEKSVDGRVFYPRVLRSCFKFFERMLSMSKIDVHRNSGSTAVVILQCHETNTLYVANLGDSRAIIVDRDSGTILMTTRDHKMTNQDELSRIDPRAISNGRIGGQLAIPRAFGNLHLKQQFPGAISIEPDVQRFCMDYFSDLRLCLVLASDGVWDVLHSRVVGQIVADTSIHRTAVAIREHAIEQNSADNITALVVAL